MGEHIDAEEVSRADRQRFRAKVSDGVRALEQMLADGTFETGRKLVGVEIELNLVDDDERPVMLNEEVLERIASPEFQTEIAEFNIEVNVTPHKLSGRVFSELEEEIRTSLNHADRRARELGAHILMIGSLPTLAELHVTEDSVTANPRYALLNSEILRSRGEDIEIVIDGVERFSARQPSIAAEGAATSTQLHLQVSPDGFAAAWNAAQAVSAVQVALGANSPFFLGRELWRETRLPLFEQSTDTRTEEMRAQGVRPRVWFGEHWIDSPLELWEENARYFPPLLPFLYPEQPAEVLHRGDVPRLGEMRLHNGTIYRWNRPVYDVARGKPHLRVENRVLPAGPTVRDTVANAAFYYGLLRALVDGEVPISQQLPFGAAAENLQAAARYGIDAELAWPGEDTRPVTELVLHRLLPLAAAGLDAWQVDPADRDRYLGVIEQRCAAGRNGASWQAAVFHRLHDDAGRDRAGALREMTSRYREHMHSNEPVHAWPLD